MTRSQQLKIIIGGTSKEAQNALKGLATAAGLAGLSLAAIGKVTSELAESAAKGIDLQRGFVRHFGQDVTKNLNTLRSASKGTVSDIDLMATANKASLLGVTTDINELGSIMQTAGLLGKEMGIDMTTSFDTIVRGIGRMSPRVLDDLGIFIPDALEKSMEGMSELQRKQILLQYTMKEGQNIIRAYGGDTVTAADRLQQLRATTKNAGNEIGKVLLPAFTGLAKVLIPIIRDFILFIRKNQEAITVIVQTIIKIGAVIMTFVLLNKAITFVVTTTKFFLAALAALRVGLTQTQLAAGVLGIVMIALGAILAKAYTEEMKFKEGLDKSDDTIKKTGTSTEDLAKGLGGLGSSGKKAGEDIAEAMEKAQNRIKELEVDIQKENEAFNEQLANIADARKEAVRDNKEQLAEEREDFEETMKDKTSTHKEEIEEQKKSLADKLADLKAELVGERALGKEASTEKINEIKETIAEEKALAREKLEKTKEEYKEETAELKKEFKERQNALKEKIKEDEKFLRKHAEVIKTINRDIIKDEIEKLVEGHQERIDEIDKQIVEEKKKMREGSDNFADSVNQMAGDFDIGTDEMEKAWEDMFDGMNDQEIDWKAILGRVDTTLSELFSKAAMYIAAGILAVAIGAMEVFKTVVESIPLVGVELAKKLELEEGITMLSEGFTSLLSQIQNFAGGTLSAPGGLSLVGEKGPELIDIPKGSRVFNTNETRNLLRDETLHGTSGKPGRGMVNVTINVPMMTGDAVSRRKVAEEIKEELERLDFSQNNLNMNI